VQDGSDLVNQLSQLEESKLVRLFRYLLEFIPVFGESAASDQIQRDPIPLDLADAEVQLKILGAVRSVNSWAYAWLFHVIHLPSFLWDPEVIETLLKARLHQASENLKASQYSLSALSRKLDPPEWFDPIPEGCDYYVFTNVLIDPEDGVFSKVAEYGHQCFDELLGGRQRVRVGLGSPETIVRGHRSQLSNFIIDLLNMPSSYYFIAREGRISVVPVTEHGSFLANSRGCAEETIGEGLSAVISSDLTVAGRPVATELTELELLINSATTKERDLQEFFRKNPELMFALDERYCEIRPHVCLYDEKGERLVPDFTARIQDSRIWDIIELKLPQHSALVRRNNLEQAAAAAARGIAELLQYRDFFSVRSHRERVRAKFGSAPYEPSLVLVIGRGRSTQHYEWRSARVGFPRVRIVSYDYLFERVRKCSASLAAAAKPRPSDPPHRFKP